jgi:cell division protein FtsI (penicillin-binding protein 3)/stage V sporulation protein D (sporulation-specific penicillin-binding protein)
MVRKNESRTVGRRMTILLLFFSLAAAGLGTRLFFLQIVSHHEYVKIASRQHGIERDLTAERGSIFVRDRAGALIPLATNHTTYTIVVSPKIIGRAREETASLLSASLGIEKEEILQKLEKENDFHEIIARNVSREKADGIRSQKKEGIFIEEERRRIYPQKTLAAHILGFANREEREEVGRYGLERYYESDLKGEQGFLQAAKDAAGFWIALGKRILHPPKKGSDLILTVDYLVQLKTEETIKSLREKWKAKSGEILVMEPKTGRILAAAAEPSYDPNEFSKVKDFSLFLNPASEFMYEFGSVMKPIIMAAGIEEGIVGPDSTYTDTGEARFGKYVIKNFDERAYGVQTMTQVLEKSLNTGAVHVAGLLGKDRHYEYLTRFGFGEKTGVDLPGEVTGSMKNLSSRRDIDFATASYGQGIAATPLQLAAAIGAIANGGNLMTPYIVEKIIDDSGNEKIEKPSLRRKIISQETAEILTKMLVSAVRNGFENRAGVKGYFVAGKTGTAQIPRRDGRGYDPNRLIHTFVGYAPAFDPRFLIVLQLNEPVGNRFASNTLTPAFHDLATFILNYYEIPSDEKEPRPQ